MNPMKVTALLPMKAHSERVKNKNMRPFAGLPLYHRVAQVLEDSGLVEQIIINTDSRDIAEDAPKNFKKVKIIERPMKLRGDLVPMNDIIAYDIQFADAEHFLQTHSTNPLLTKETLEQTIQEYFRLLPEHDSLFSVNSMQGRFYWSSGEPVNHNPQELLRTQDLPPLLEENSNIYLFSKASFTATGKRRIGLKPKMFVMDKLEAVDIDEEEDWVLAEALYKLRNSETAS
jgi:CMP-N-acetylneuraminic acid synthetase